METDTGRNLRSARLFCLFTESDSYIQKLSSHHFHDKTDFIVLNPSENRNQRTALIHTPNRYSLRKPRAKKKKNAHPATREMSFLEPYGADRGDGGEMAVPAPMNAGHPLPSNRSSERSFLSSLPRLPLAEMAEKQRVNFPFQPTGAVHRAPETKVSNESGRPPFYYGHPAPAAHSMAGAQPPMTSTHNTNQTSAQPTNTSTPATSRTMLTPTPTPRNKHELLSAARDKLKAVRTEERDISTLYLSTVEGRDAAMRALHDGVPSLAERIERLRASTAAIAMSVSLSKGNSDTGGSPSPPAVAVSSVTSQQTIADQRTNTFNQFIENLRAPSAESIRDALKTQLHALIGHIERLAVEEEELRGLEVSQLKPLEAKVAAAEERHKAWQRIVARREGEVQNVRGEIQKKLQEIKKTEEWMREWLFDSAFFALSPVTGLPSSPRQVGPAGYESGNEPNTLAAALCIKQLGPSSLPASQAIAKRNELVAAIAANDKKIKELNAYITAHANDLTVAELREEVAGNAQLLKGYTIRINALEKERRRRPRKEEIGERLIKARAQAEHLKAEYARQKEELALLTNDPKGLTAAFTRKRRRQRTSASSIKVDQQRLYHNNANGNENANEQKGGAFVSDAVLRALQQPTGSSYQTSLITSRNNVGGTLEPEEADEFDDYEGENTHQTDTARRKRYSKSADGQLLIRNDLGSKIDKLHYSRSTSQQQQLAVNGGQRMISSSFGFGRAAIDDNGGDNDNDDYCDYAEASSPVTSRASGVSELDSTFGDFAADGDDGAAFNSFVSPITLVSRDHHTTAGGDGQRGNVLAGAGVPAASSNLLLERCQEIRYELAALQERTLPELRRLHGELKGAVYDASVLVPEAWESEERRHRIHIGALESEKARLKETVEAMSRDVAALQLSLQSKVTEMSSSSAAKSSSFGLWGRGGEGATSNPTSATGRVAGALLGTASAVFGSKLLWGKKSNGNHDWKKNPIAAAPPRSTVSGVLDDLPSSLRTSTPPPQQALSLSSSAAARASALAVDKSQRSQHSEHDTPSRHIRFEEELHGAPRAAAEFPGGTTEPASAPTRVGNISEGASLTHDLSSFRQPAGGLLPRRVATTPIKLPPELIVRDRLNGVEVVVPGDDITYDSLNYTSAGLQSFSSPSRTPTALSVARVNFYEISTANAAANNSLLIDAVQSFAHRSSFSARDGNESVQFSVFSERQSQKDNLEDRRLSHLPSPAATPIRLGAAPTPTTTTQLYTPSLAGCGHRSSDRLLMIVCDAPRPANSTIMRVTKEAPVMKVLPKRHGAPSLAPPLALRSATTTHATPSSGLKTAGPSTSAPSAVATADHSSSSVDAIFSPLNASVGGVLQKGEGERPSVELVVGGSQSTSTCQKVSAEGTPAFTDGGDRTVDTITMDDFVLVSANESTVLLSTPPPPPSAAPKNPTAVDLLPPRGLFSRVMSLPMAAIALPYSGIHSSIKKFVAPPSESAKAREELRQAVALRAQAAAAASNLSPSTGGFDHSGIASAATTDSVIRL